MIEKQRCKSQFCIIGSDNIRGREFIPPDQADGLAKLWCAQCMSIGKQITFFSSQTAEMIRNVYAAYDNTDLPKNVKMILNQFAIELVRNLGEEL